MPENLSATTLRLYRHLRRYETPAESLERLRSHVRAAREYAIDWGAHTLAAELRDQESHLTYWLQATRFEADANGRHGEFWRTGKFKGPLRFTVSPTGDNRSAFEPIVCESAGCAIKHALSALRRPDVFEVLISDSWTDEVRLLDESMPLSELNLMTWPVD